MKRLTHLMPDIADAENLREAYLRAAKGKRTKAEVVEYAASLDDHLACLRDRLLTGSFRFGEYHYFRINDPKPRIICAAKFEERVAQHAMMRILHPTFEAYQISDSYACRIGKGSYKAIERAGVFCRQYQWFAKLDVRKFFNSIDHSVLYAQLERLFKDRSLLVLLEQLLDSYETDVGKGLPIGNLSSQYFANHYMGRADHFAKETLRQKAYLRYMDDVVMWSNDGKTLRRTVKEYAQFLHDVLLLDVHPIVMNRTHFGMPFLGYVVYPHTLRLNQRSRHRYRHRLAVMERLVAEGTITEAQALRSYEAMTAFVEKANAESFVSEISRKEHSRRALTV